MIILNKLILKKYACFSEQLISDGDYAIMPVQSQHIQKIREWRNSQRDILRQSECISIEQQEAYYGKYIWPTMLDMNPKNILMSFFYKSSLIGYGGLVHISWENLRAEISFLLDPQRLDDKSTYILNFKIFLKLIKRLAFNQLKFHRLYTETYDIRPDHIATLEEMGFVQEGILRDHNWINDRPINSIMHGCLKNDDR